jgi:purine-binding chemotaxis protein CheW
MNAPSRRLGTFRIEGLHFGVDVRNIQEVIRYQPMTGVPLAPAAVRGLINLRGQIVTAVDLRERLALPARAEDKLPMNVVVQTDGGIVSLLVDEIGDVVDATPEQFETPPPTLPSSIAALIEGAYKMPGWLLLMLNIREAVNIATPELSLHSV